MSQDVCGETGTRPNLQQLLPEIDPTYGPGEEILSQVPLPEVRPAVPSREPIHTGGLLSHGKELTLLSRLCPGSLGRLVDSSDRIQKPRMPFPSPCPSSGNFLGPKMGRAIARKEKSRN